MGAWGINTFDNDDASDWVYELEETGDASFVVETLETVAQYEDDYAEASACARALAAAEVVAALMNAGSSSLPNEVKQWVDQHRAIRGQEYAQTALRAVERVKTNSELKELWDESDSAAEWYDTLQDLEKRLRQK